MANWIQRFLEAIASRSKVVWLDTPEQIVSDADRTSTLTWTPLDISAQTSSKAKFAILSLKFKADTVGTGNNSGLMVKKGGVVATQYPELRLGQEVTVATLYPLEVIVGLSDTQVVDYRISVGTGWQVDSYIYVLGYIE